ncbi:LysM repeat protein [Clostridium algifaecis]|uniref:LysM repeat protein n=1 Tax=Clostridium algifaecis TaxID=1472040 RepID=A0ABS4KQQ2_9CLOT|nr:SPOCS domain-containing protein [Clostridium algifaecis]MBP2032359.1 LysM repeat protein [Clostridium algifaecis]
MSIDLVKENIECEQLLAENFCDTVIKAEYVIPDTHPDVSEILILDASPVVTNKEVMQDKIFLEGKINYNILYLAKEENDESGIYSVDYTGDFSNYVEISGAEHTMLCDSDCYIEHMDCTIVNERKIGIKGIVKLKAEVYKNYDFEVVKDIAESDDDVQMLKNPATLDKIMGTVNGNLIAKTEIQIPTDKPQVGDILKIDTMVHKKDIKILDDKIQLDAFVLIKVLYRGKDTKEVVMIEDDVPVNKDLELKGVTPSMNSFTDFDVDGLEYTVREDDLGEDRIVQLEALVKSNTKVMYKEDMDIIEDVYSPQSLMKIDKKNYELNVIYGQNTVESMVKSNIEMENDERLQNIIMCHGDVCITGKKIVEDKVVVEGVVNVKVLYETSSGGIRKANEEIPFNSSIDIPGSKIDMQCIAKVSIESIDTDIEVNTIAVKAVIEIYARVNYITHKEFLINVDELDGEIPGKKASLTIYVVQNGDTLWKIAKRYCTTIQDLVKLNDIEDPDVIKIGDKLLIPGRAII